MKNVFRTWLLARADGASLLEAAHITLCQLLRVEQIPALRFNRWILKPVSRKPVRILVLRPL